jgi:cytochrome c551/c552
MKRIAFILFIMVGLAGTIAVKEGVGEEGENENGIVLFKQRGCGVCHDRTKDQTIYGLGPSLEQIAEAYEGNEDDLAKFLRGGCAPILIIEEEKYSLMHGEIVKLKGLSDSQIKDLQEYICGK